MYRFMRYFDTAFPTAEPKWTTENQIVFETNAVRLRQFRGGNGYANVVVPPQAGHSSTIADFDNNQSMIQTILDSCDGPVYCIEWLSATQDRKNESIADLIVQLDQIVCVVNSKVHLIGLCQGGWLATMYTAMYQQNVATLLLSAAPIDFHADGGPIYETITKHGMKPYADVVDQNNGIMSGKMMLLGWKLMNPVDRFFGDYLSIWTDTMLGNTDTLEKVKKFRTWYEYTQDLSGVWYLEACELLFLKNLLISGELVIGSKTIDLSRITCRVAMIAGEKDEITLPNHLFNLANYISSTEVYKEVIPGCGHVGCFMGRKSQEYVRQVILWRDYEQEAKKESR